MDNFVPATDYEYGLLMDTLNKNADKSFVKRILQPANFPVLQQGRNIATHKMAWTEDDGKYYVYPTVLMEKGGKLKDYGPEKAWEQVRQTGNLIPFDNADDAEWFSSRYKAAWGGLKNKPPR